MAECAENCTDEAEEGDFLCADHRYMADCNAKDSYPVADEYTKQAKAHGDILTAFYDWLWGQGYRICADNAESDATEYDYWPTTEQPEDLFRGFFAIDPHKLDLERRAMLEKLRETA